MKGSVPANFQEIGCWRIAQNSWRLVIVNLLSIPLLMLAGILFFGWAALFNPSALGASQSVNFWTGFLIAIVVMLVLHEGIHGLAMAKYGAKPKFGILLKALEIYTTAEGYAFRRNEYVVTILAPAVGLSILSLIGIIIAPPALALTLIGAATLNVACAVGDIWILTVILRYPSYSYVTDEKDGMRIFVPD